MEDNQINGQKISKEAYCPNSFFDNGTISIGEFKTLDDAMNFPIKEIWCINRTEDNKFNSYVSQGCRLLIICDWNKSIQDSQKFVVALISKSGKITYWDLNDLPINTKQYENSIDNDVLTAIFAVADELYRNNNQLNCNTNMNKKLIRLTEQDLHRIVKESVNRVLKEDSGLPRINPQNIGVVKAVRNLVKELEKVGADDKYIDMAYRIEWDFVDSYGDDGFDDEMLNNM